MRLRGRGCWVSLTCVASLLTVAVGCEIVPPEDGKDDSGKDPSNTGPQNPGTGARPGDGSQNPVNNVPPGGTGQNGMPAVRKLALDLKGVAGFAILDQDGDSSTRGTPAPGAAGSSAAASPSSMLWLTSQSSGQVIQTGAKLDVDMTQLGASVLARRGMSTPTAGLSAPGWISQQDPGDPTKPAEPGVGTDVAAPAPPADGTTEASAGEQAGLLKITEDGEVTPALVALEEAPLDGTDAAAGNAPTAAGDPAANGEPATGTGGASGSGTGSGGAASGGTASGGAAAPAPSGTAGAAATGTKPGSNGTISAPTHYEPLPRVTAVGLSPDGNVYILFEHSFFYRQPAAEDLVAGFDPYAPGSPYRCQLFRANGNWQTGGTDGSPLAELECVTSDYEIRTWDARRVMQFDASGKLYFRAATPGVSKEVFYAYDPQTRLLSEKVNGNICWRDVQVTPRGSLFYTGISGTNGDCSGTSFFRYVSADNRLTEIARDWWNFKYLAEQDPEDPTNERIIFYGPDPNATTGSGWESACLYRYNPAIADPALRTEKLVECVSNAFNYVYGGNQGPTPVSDADLPSFKERCESDGQLFVGGEGVTGLSQLRDGTLFVVGKFQKKIAGEVHCGLDVNVDHCDSVDPAHVDKTSCESAGHQWLSANGYCSNELYGNAQDCQMNSAQWTNGFGFRHYDQLSGAACTTPREGFTRPYLDCRTPGQAQPGPSNLTQEVDGLAFLTPGSDGALSQLRLLSDPAEQVERYWALDGESGPELYYSVYNAGQYNLRLATQVPVGEGEVEIQRRLVLADYEVYNLQRDPADPKRVMFDALQFSTNNYLFGSADTTLPTSEEVQASVQAVAGVSGRVETLIVLPTF